MDEDRPTSTMSQDCPQDGSESVAEHLGRLQRLSLAVIRSAGSYGLTALETASATGFDRYSIQPRISELRAKGRVVDGGKRRRNPSGRSAIVWVAKDVASSG
ncbi:MAG: hypothetical protein R3D89_11715 [Sphingomonadaceae bacterium]